MGNICEQMRQKTEKCEKHPHGSAGNKAMMSDERNSFDGLISTLDAAEEGM